MSSKGFLKNVRHTLERVQNIVRSSPFAQKLLHYFVQEFFYNNIILYSIFSLKFKYIFVLFYHSVLFLHFTQLSMRSTVISSTIYANYFCFIFSISG